ncbi:MAG: OB-fold nucleic acid binding domain-containing protein [archaeon]
MMKIKEIKNGSKDVEVEATVKEVTEPRNVQTKFGPSQVASAILDDGSGKIKLTLWGSKISEVKKGDRVKVVGAYVTEWNNELQLNVPKTGEMIIEGDGAEDEPFFEEE